MHGEIRVNLLWVQTLQSSNNLRYRNSVTTPLKSEPSTPPHVQLIQQFLDPPQQLSVSTTAISGSLPT